MLRDEEGDGRKRNVSAAVRGLKDVAGELGVPVLALVQSWTELHSLLYPYGHDEQFVRRTDAVHLLDQKTLSSDLQNM